MYQPHEFYKGFQVNHFDYKQLSNKLLLEMPDDEILKLIDPIINGSIEQFRRSIKMDIRLTFLLSVETLFELVFGLLPDDNNRINDSRLLFRLVERRYYYEDIRNFMKGEKSRLDKLDQRFKFPNGKISTFLRYLFFFGLWKDDIENQINLSLPVIKNALVVLANELSNREELNSYKHGFRGIPFMKNFIIADPDTMAEQLRFNMDDSLTIYSHNKKTRVTEYLTKTFDPERDILLTHLTSNLINNIMEPRKFAFVKKIEKPSLIFFFYEEDISHASKVNVQIKDCLFRIEPVESKH